MTEIILNGAPHQVAPGTTLADLIETLSLSDQAVALAINRNVVPRAQWRVRGMEPGDRLDIIHAIGGG
jgi:sulfur carrier protein